MATIQDIKLRPWDRLDWTGELISVDGVDAADFKAEDVAEVLHYAATADDWDGETVGVVRLKDGRFVAWEADWEPTGNGFCCDAYGGTADIVFGNTKEAAMSRLSERGKEVLRDYEVK